MKDTQKRHSTVVINKASDHNEGKKIQNASISMKDNITDKKHYQR